VANDPKREHRIAFYRAWSSEAAEQASIADHPGAITRCNHSAAIWTLIADSIEADKGTDVQRLTNNLLLLRNGCHILLESEQALSPA
jgi:hypothetical protein